jgi:hypothetical protein
MERGVKTCVVRRDDAEMDMAGTLEVTRVMKGRCRLETSFFLIARPFPASDWYGRKDMCQEAPRPSVTRGSRRLLRVDRESLVSNMHLECQIVRLRGSPQTQIRTN